MKLTKFTKILLVIVSGLIGAMAGGKIASTIYLSSRDYPINPNALFDGYDGVPPTMAAIIVGSGIFMTIAYIVVQRPKPNKTLFLKLVLTALIILGLASFVYAFFSTLIFEPTVETLATANQGSMLAFIGIVSIACGIAIAIMARKHSKLTT